MMSLERRSFRRRSMNIGTMKMAVWCPGLTCTYYFDYGGGWTLSYTYDDESRLRRSYS
jgi:uncharacterized membrane protein